MGRLFIKEIKDIKFIDMRTGKVIASFDNPPIHKLDFHNGSVTLDLSEEKLYDTTEDDDDE